MSLRQSLRTTFCLALLASPAAAKPAPAKVAPGSAARHADAAAGLAFDNPFPGGKDKTARDLSTVNANPVARAAHITYTSGIDSPTKVPFILVWTMPFMTPLTKDLVKQLGSGSEDLVFKLIGMKHWTFDKAKLQGQGEPPDISGFKCRVALQVTKDHFAFVGYYYQTASQLAPWQAVLKSLTVDKAARVDLKALPSGGGGGWLKTGLFALLLGGLSVFAYLAYKRRRLQAEAIAPAPIVTGAVPTPLDPAA